MSKEAMKMALEAFGEIAWSNETQWQRDRAKKAITAIKEALEQPEPEPVAWTDMAYARLGMVRDKMHPDDVATVQRFLEGDYTSPPKREWQGLTDDEIKQIEETTTCEGNESWLRNLTRNIEAKLKEKNT